MNAITMIIQKTVIRKMLFLIIAHVVFMSPSPAAAALGGDETTVQADHTRMRGTMRSTPTEKYIVHEIEAPTGTVVKEYVSPTGRIFAVVWQGPFLPDLRQLLGSYFEQFSQSAKKLKSKRPRVRGPLLIHEPGLVVQTGGHMRAYFGRAYVPELVPEGVSSEEIP